MYKSEYIFYLDGYPFSILTNSVLCGNLYVTRNGFTLMNGIRYDDAMLRRIFKVSHKQIWFPIF